MVVPLRTASVWNNKRHFTQLSPTLSDVSVLNVLFEVFVVALFAQDGGLPTDLEDQDAGVRHRQAQLGALAVLGRVQTNPVHLQTTRHFQ